MNPPRPALRFIPTLSERVRMKERGVRSLSSTPFGSSTTRNKRSDAVLLVRRNLTSMRNSGGAFCSCRKSQFRRALDRLRSGLSTSIEACTTLPLNKAVSCMGPTVFGILIPPDSVPVLTNSRATQAALLSGSRRSLLLRTGRTSSPSLDPNPRHKN